jgi:hypothetical protein
VLGYIECCRSKPPTASCITYQPRTGPKQTNVNRSIMVAIRYTYPRAALVLLAAILLLQHVSLGVAIESPHRRQLKQQPTTKRRSAPPFGAATKGFKTSSFWKDRTSARRGGNMNKKDESNYSRENRIQRQLSGYGSSAWWKQFELLEGLSKRLVYHYGGCGDDTELRHTTPVRVYLKSSASTVR